MLQDAIQCAGNAAPQDFSARLITWQKRHGRHHLPWQSHDPYRVWLSEIMLQQTQVGTVLGYYAAFLERFPTLAALAQAPLDDVLAAWSGLGYYSRARNLHRAAQAVMTQHGGVFPSDFDAVLALPGIGRSTAAAILAFAFGQRRAILDGNVKRVLTRIFGIAGWPGEKAVEQQLWHRAESLLPMHDIEAYTQGLMDLGSVLCTRTPTCTPCPFNGQCVAQQQGRTRELPTSRPKKVQPIRDATLFVLQRDDGRILLERRPNSGIWGGLWSLPQGENGAALTALLPQFSCELLEILPAWPEFEHVFTHFRLIITPQPVRVTVLRDHPGIRWLVPEQALALGLPAPVRKLLVADQFS